MTEHMTNEELVDALEAITDRITDGNWYWWMSDVSPFDLGNDHDVDIGIRVKNSADAEFICTIRNYLPQMIEALRGKAT